MCVRCSGRRRRKRGGKCVFYCESVVSSEQTGIDDVSEVILCGSALQIVSSDQLEDVLLTRVSTKESVAELLSVSAYSTGDNSFHAQKRLKYFYEEVLYLQPMIPPKRFDVFPPRLGGAQKV